MATVMKFGPKAFVHIAKSMAAPFRETKEFFIKLGARYSRDTNLVFRMQGAAFGRRKWRPFALSTLRTKRGTPKIRYGTDKKPKRNAAQLARYKTDNNLWYKPGKMKGYKSDRRYGPNSKLLQASGGFKRSFEVIKTSKRRMIFGTRMKEAADIMSKPTRNVLGVSRKQEEAYSRMWLLFYDKKFKV
jgi:hypothetical protein